MTRTGAAARPDLDERAENVREWIELHSRELTILLVAVVVVVAGGWFYVKAHEARARTASTTLTEAEQAVASGNLPLAQSTLETVIARYGSTPSGREAHLLLAQVMYDRGHYQEGVAELQKVIATDDKPLLASAYNLQGAGYEQQSKFADAAAAYQKAASAAVYAGDRDSYLANAARALTSAGKTEEAKAIWSKLAADPTSPATAEARVRLGELEVKPVKQG